MALGLFGKRSGHTEQEADRLTDKVVNGKVEEATALAANNEALKALQELDSVTQRKAMEAALRQMEQQAKDNTAQTPQPLEGGERLSDKSAQEGQAPGRISEEVIAALMLSSALPVKFTAADMHQKGHEATERRQPLPDVRDKTQQGLSL